MKIFRGIKIGGLQHKIFNLMLFSMIFLIAAFVAVNLYQQKNLSGVVQEASTEQQDSIASVSEQTMDAVLESTMTKTTALQAYIAGDLFGDVRTAVETLQAYATDIFANESFYSAHPFYPPKRENDGVPSVQFQYEEGVDPYASKSLGLVANMSEVMLAMFTNSDKLSSCFIATADGTILFVDDRAGEYFDEDGSVFHFPVRSRPWYKNVSEAGRLIFTGLELDAFTNIPGIVCAAPVYKDGELVAVVGADLFLTSIREYVQASTTDGSFLCVISDRGQVLFSPREEGAFRPMLSVSAPDLRMGRNTELASFVTEALKARTGLTEINVDGTDYYLCGAPIDTIGWAVISAVEKNVTRQPADAMLANYESINDKALNTFTEGTKNSMRTFVILTAALLLLSAAAALILAGRIVNPVEKMTKRINEIAGTDEVFEMDKTYRTNDEIEVLAQSFESLTKKTRDYIGQITEITAEKERIGTELALANQIQADMLPNIYPAFPDRPEFDVYASMDPAKEVGGDFYDFFLIDDDHLCTLIADVSGKGVPAALFMMASKIILANFANLGKSPAEVLKATNDAICSNNREDMFVTVWLGILEISTGKLTASNAGHEYPTVMHPDGRFELFKDRHGFVIGGMSGMDYTDYEFLLEPGSKVFVYTDGVPEAMDAERNQFGTDRMLEALNGDTSATPEDLLKNVRAAVDAFVKDAEQFDDLTMLALEYKGPRK
jgi:sigma-B regulation protein RsbU (phosphoserine phosphatase)